MITEQDREEDKARACERFAVLGPMRVQAMLDSAALPQLWEGHAFEWLAQQQEGKQ